MIHEGKIEKVIGDMMKEEEEGKMNECNNI